MPSFTLVSFNCLLSFALSASAETLTTTYSDKITSEGVFSESSEQTDSFVLSIPRFNPSTGRLLSVTYAYSDLQETLAGWNDEEVPPGLPFTVTVTSRVLGPFGALPEQTLSTNLDTTGYFHMISLGGLNFRNDLSIAGTLHDLIEFTGQGDILFSLGSTVDIGTIGPPGFLVVSGINQDIDSASLTITYKYVPTPEPRTAWFVGAVLGATFLIAGRSKMRTHRSS